MLVNKRSKKDHARAISFDGISIRIRKHVINSDTADVKETITTSLQKMHVSIVVDNRVKAEVSSSFLFFLIDYMYST